MFLPPRFEFIWVWFGGRSSWSICRSCILLLKISSGGTGASLTDVCLNFSFQLYSSPVFRLYSDIPTLNLDRLSVSYTIFHSFCQARWNLCPTLRGNGPIKRPRLPFLSECGDIFNPRLFSVSLQLLGYGGAQCDTLQTIQRFFT